MGSSPEEFLVSFAIGGLWRLFDYAVKKFKERKAKDE